VAELVSVSSHAGNHVVGAAPVSRAAGAVMVYMRHWLAASGAAQLHAHNLLSSCRCIVHQAPCLVHCRLCCSVLYSVYHCAVVDVLRNRFII
jgi:hypothetical protein